MSVNKRFQERDFTPCHIGALRTIDKGAEINWLNEMRGSGQRPAKHTHGYLEGMWQARIIVLKLKVKGLSVGHKGCKQHFMDTQPH